MDSQASSSYCFVAVNYYQSKCLFDFISSILAFENLSSANLCVYIINNSGESLELPVQTSVNVNVLNPFGNLGYFGGFNYFLRCVDFSSFGKLIFCNPDLQFDSKFLINLQQACYYCSSFDLLAPDILDSRGVHQNPSLLFRPSSLKRFYYRIFYSHYFIFVVLSLLSSAFQPFQVARRSVLLKRITSIYLAHGSCFILDPLFFNGICKELICPSFLWGEEMFLRHQVSVNGGSLIYVPFLKVFHSSHTSTANVSPFSKFTLMRSAYMNYRFLY